MSKLITIIDYNVGNILNVVRAFHKIGCEVVVAETPDQVHPNTDLLVLPGVGAFAPSIAEIKSRGFLETLTEFKNSDKPIMGICLGMQMLFEESQEMGSSKGLGFLKGTIDRIPFQEISGKKFTVPNIGWHHMKSTRAENVKSEGTVYFVHSYYVKDAAPEDLVTTIHYGQVQIPAIVRRKNVFGFQFHPEKSGFFGLELLKQFVDSL